MPARIHSQQCRGLELVGQTKRLALTGEGISRGLSGTQQFCELQQRLGACSARRPGTGSMRRVFQHIVAVAVGTRHANNCGDELMQRTSAFCQAACCSLRPNRVLFLIAHARRLPRALRPSWGAPLDSESAAQLRGATIARRKDQQSRREAGDPPAYHLNPRIMIWNQVID